MPAGRSGPSIRRLGALLIVSAIAIAACGNGSGSPRPTDPRAILVNAIAATAAVPTLRIHVDVAANAGPAAGQANAKITMALDADVDLATRQFAGRTTTQMPGGFGGNGGVAVPQVSDVIVTQAATFNRDSGTGRWSKFPTAGLGGGPTNAQIATMITNLLSNPSITFELREASPCSLGTCDHVIAHIDGQILGAALGPLLGMPVDTMGAAIPNFDIDVLVDQATSVISELRAVYALQGMSTQIVLTVSNPGQPIQIAPPPPALTDDFGGMNGGFGGGGIAPAPPPILETVGNGGETPPPIFVEESPSLP
jgi:hypothetical protein